MQSFGKHCTTSQLEIPNESMVFEAPSSSEVQGGSRLFMLTRNDYDTQTILGKFLVDCHESPRRDSQRIHACKHETCQCSFASTSFLFLVTPGNGSHILPVFEQTEGRFLIGLEDKKSILQRQRELRKTPRVGVHDEWTGSAQAILCIITFGSCCCCLKY